MSIPFFDKENKLLQDNGDGERLRHYYTFGRMLVKLAEAIGRLVLAGREMSRLAGFTTRMDELIRVLNDLNSGKYERTMVSNSASADTEIGVGQGVISFQDNIIKFDNVPLVTPNGDLLVKELSFEVRSGTNVLVCGPNGKFFKSISTSLIQHCFSSQAVENQVCSVFLVNFGHHGEDVLPNHHVENFSTFHNVLT